MRGSAARARITRAKSSRPRPRRHSQRSKERVLACMGPAKMNKGPFGEARECAQAFGARARRPLKGVNLIMIAANDEPVSAPE